jgi:chromosome partitioning protein
LTAKIVTVFNQKGGCTKTMTTMQLAGEFGELGLKVFVVDMDPQNTAAMWRLQAPLDQPFPAEVVSMAPLRGQFVSKLSAIVEKYDLILIDCPPAIESDVPWKSLLVADFALIPVIPTMDNVWASKQAEELFHKAREERSATGDHQLKAAYLVSQVRRGNVFDACLAALTGMATLPILKARVTMRNAFPESQLWGTSVAGMGKSAASKEISAVGQEIAKLIDLKLPKKR